MNRGLWEFEYTASRLAEAATAQREYRKSRVAVWEGKKEEVMRKIKDSGLTVHEGVAAQLSGYSNSVRGGAAVMVDPTLQTDLSECVSKIQEHQKAATEYDGWIQMLSANPEARLKLKYHDWMFFFGK
jgi:hypothetical protein